MWNFEKGLLAIYLFSKVPKIGNLLLVCMSFVVVATSFTARVHRFRFLLCIYDDAARWYWRICKSWVVAWGADWGDWAEGWRSARVGGSWQEGGAYQVIFCVYAFTSNSLTLADSIVYNFQPLIPYYMSLIKATILII